MFVFLLVQYHDKEFLLFTMVLRTIWDIFADVQDKYAAKMSKQAHSITVFPKILKFFCTLWCTVQVTFQLRNKLFEFFFVNLFLVHIL